MLRDLLSQMIQRNDSKRSKLRVRYDLAYVLFEQGRYSDAEELFRQVLGKHREISNRERLHLMTGLGRALRHQRKFTEAEDVARWANEYASIHGPGDRRSQCALLDLGKVKLDQNAYAEAATLLEQACDATANSIHPKHLECQRILARALRHLHSYDKALVRFERVVDGYAQAFGVEDKRTRKYSRKLDGLREFLAARKTLKADCERDSLRIARALDTRSVLAGLHCGLSTGLYRSASSSGLLSGKIRVAEEERPHMHTTECDQDGCARYRRWLI